MVEINREGASRLVLLTARYAVKIPSIHSWKHFLLGLLANMQESLFSRTGDERLCPVLFHIPGGWLIVMPRAVVLEPEQFSGFDYAAFINDGDMVVPVEEKWNSFGILNGRVVAIDYGS